MSTAPESSLGTIAVTNAGHVIPIAQLEPWTLWVSRRVVLISPEDEVAYRSGKNVDAIRLKIETQLQLMLNALRDAEVPGVQAWMSPKRMAS